MADKSGKTIDPFDVEALEKSLNDSATRVSTIWVSFLIFSLYLLTAATTVTHRQLFLAEPVKLPVLNIDLPLWGFFFLAPILFVILHAYVLIQVILLARTAAAYNEAVDQHIKVGTDNARVRQRLANTLFAQIFAGSPRERAGWLGWLLRAMAWITLAIAPILILLTFQFMFLPYHSHLATWVHRLLVFADLVAVFFLWPLVTDGKREFRRPNVSQKLVAAMTVVAFSFVSLLSASFPGEPHLNLLNGNPVLSVTCARWLSMSFDRLSISREVFVDDEKLAKIENRTKERNLEPSSGERTRNFRNRDLNCGALDQTDLRRADFTDAKAIRARFVAADLEGAIFDRAMLREADFGSARAWSASFSEANLQGANFALARLQTAYFFAAELQGANLWGAQLQWTYLLNSRLEGANLSAAQFQGAILQGAQLKAASLIQAGLQGVDLTQAQLQGSNLSSAQIAGAKLHGADLTLANLSDVLLWGAEETECHTAQVAEPNFSTMVATIPLIVNDEGTRDGRPEEDEYKATTQDIERFVEQRLDKVPEVRRNKLRAQLRDALLPGTRENSDNSAERTWRACALNALPIPEYTSKLVSYLLETACAQDDNQPYVIKGILRNWAGNPLAIGLVRGVLEMDGKVCAAATNLDEKTKADLRATIAEAADPVPTPGPSAGPAAR